MTALTDSIGIAKKTFKRTQNNLTYHYNFFTDSDETSKCKSTFDQITAGIIVATSQIFKIRNLNQPYL